MAPYPDARFVKSASAARDFVADTGAEVAVAGRSNAGKSSAINRIVNRRGLARTSKSPGRTQLVNFFDLRPGRRLVDLPGYGFARVPEHVRRGWRQLLASYFEQRRSLAGLLLVVDIRRGLTDFDRQMLAFAGAVPVHVLLTKADKLGRGALRTALADARRQLDGQTTVQAFSAVTGEGEEEARSRLEGFFADQAKKGPGAMQMPTPGQS